MRKAQLAIATLMAAVPLFAHAWTPYGAGPYPYQAPAAPYGQPFPSPYGPMVPWTMPQGRYGDARQTQGTAPSPEPGAQAAVPGDGRSARPLVPRPVAARPRLDVDREMTEDAYLLDIALQNIDPEQVKIRPMRRGVLIAYSNARQVDRQETLPGGQGYRSSYSLARGVATRRVALPSDADPAGLSTETKDGHILVRIPRHANAGPGWWPSAAPQR